MIQRRDYQVRSAELCEWHMALKTGPVLLVQPTGTGKTVTAVSIINHRVELGQRVLFLAPRREIVKQTADKVVEFGMRPGVIMSGTKYTPRFPVQVASIDTLRSWIQRGLCKLDAGTLLVVDEAHRAMGKTLQWLIYEAMKAGADVLGMTATPFRSDGVGLGRTFKHLVNEMPVVRAIKEGWLVKPELFLPFVPDLDGVKIVGGEYSQRDLDRILNQEVLVGDIVDNWMKHARNLPTLAFGCSVEHSIAIADHFRQAGFRAVHVDGNSTTKHRDDAIRDMKNYNLDVICNFGVFTEGTDIPNLGAIIDAGPTKSLGKQIQKIGRGARPMYMDGFDLDTINGRLASIAASEKPTFKLLDHAGNFYRHGHFARNIDMELCEGKEIVEKDRIKREKARVSFTCRACKRVFSGQDYCPNCGTKIERKGKLAHYLPGELVSMSKEQYEKAEKAITWRDQRDFYLEVLQWCRTPNKGQIDPRHKDGFAAHVYKQKFGEFPPFDWRDLPDKKPTKETLNYIRHCNMRRAKANAVRKRYGTGNREPDPATP